MAQGGYDDESDGEYNAGHQAEDNGGAWRLQVAGEQGAKAEAECEAGDSLRVVAQGVSDHARSHEQHEDEVEHQRVDHSRGIQMMHGIGGEKGKRPATPDAAAGEDPIGGLALKPYAAGQHCEADSIAAGNFAHWAPGLQLIGEEEGDADDEDGDAELVEPVCAEAFFEAEGGRARFFFGRWPGG